MRPLALALPALVAVRPDCRAAVVPLDTATRVNDSVVGDQFAPQVYPLGSGGFVVLWIGPPSESAYARGFDAGGQPLGDEYLIEGARGFPAATTQGNLLVVAGTEEILFVEVAAGAVERRLSRAAIGRDPTFSANATGALGVTWNGPGIYGQRLEPRSGPVFVVSEATDPDNGYPHSSRIAAFPDDSFLIVWWAEESSLLWGRHVDSTDVLGDRFALASRVDLWGLSLCVDAESETAVVAWGAGEPAQFRRVTAATLPVTKAQCTDISSRPAVACPGRGRVVLSGTIATDDDQRYVALRAFDAQERPVGHALIPVTPSFGTASAAVTALADGSIALAWTDCALDGPEGCDVFAQRFALTDSSPCPGDCDGNREVAIDELVTGVDLFLHGGVPAGRCLALLTDLAECGVSIGELVSAVEHALEGCPF